MPPRTTAKPSGAVSRLRGESLQKGIEGVVAWLAQQEELDDQRRAVAQVAFRLAGAIERCERDADQPPQALAPLCRALLEALDRLRPMEAPDDDDDLDALSDSVRAALGDPPLT